MPPQQSEEANNVTVLDPTQLQDVPMKCNKAMLEDCADLSRIHDEKSEVGLTKLQKLCYGVGHVYNDLCASMWFSYLLIFFEKVLVFDGNLAGVILLVGQLADGFATPLVGIMSDRENKIPICARYGRRKIWHLIGTICTTISFPFIFSPAYGLEDSGFLAQTFYYCFFVIIFQFGWASVQISHLALIPDLTCRKSLRTELNSIRYAFTVLSNLSVFAIALVMLEMNSSDPITTLAPLNLTTTPATTTLFPPTAPGDDVCDNVDTSLNEGDLDAFRIIALICVGVGLFFSIVFHIGVKEPAYQTPAEQGRGEVRMRKLDWFKQLPFYVVALLYMATRLYNNLYMVYIPLLVQDTLCLAKSAIATVPFAMYLAGFLFSLIMKPLNRIIGRKGTFASGCVIGLIGCTWTFTSGYMTNDAFTTWGIYVVAVFLGSGGSTLLITSLSITADLIGKNTEGGAFVYGLMSLVDKFSNGFAIMLIQNEDTGMSSYYRQVMFYACGGACVMGIVAVLFMIPTDMSARRGLKAASNEKSEKSDKDGDNNNTGVCTKQNPTSEILTCVANKAVADGDARAERKSISESKMTGELQGRVNPAADLSDSISPNETQISAYTIDIEPSIADRNIERVLEQDGVSQRDKRSSISSIKDMISRRMSARDDVSNDSQSHTRQRTTSVRSYEMVSPDHNPTADILDRMSQNVVAAAERRESVRTALE